MKLTQRFRIQNHLVKMEASPKQSLLTQIRYLYMYGSKSAPHLQDPSEGGGGADVQHWYHSTLSCKVSSKRRKCLCNHPVRLCIQSVSAEAVPGR